MTRVSDLAGAELDYWVARATGAEPYYPADHKAHHLWLKNGKFGSCIATPLYSTGWQYGGPLIEKHLISTIYDPASGQWSGFFRAVDDIEYTGPTPLIAAMRALVASVYGEEVES